MGGFPVIHGLDHGAHRGGSDRRVTASRAHFPRWGHEGRARRAAPSTLDRGPRSPSSWRRAKFVWASSPRAAIRLVALSRLRFRHPDEGAFTPYLHVQRRMALTWGIESFPGQECHATLNAIVRQVDDILPRARRRGVGRQGRRDRRVRLPESPAAPTTSGCTPVGDTVGTELPAWIAGGSVELGRRALSAIAEWCVPAVGSRTPRREPVSRRNSNCALM